MKRAVTVACMLGLVMGFCGNAIALSTVVETMPPNLTDIPALSEFATTGADMAGMSIAVFYSAGSYHGVDIQPWRKLGEQSGGAFGRGWSLTQSGDTYKSPWVFSVRDTCFTVDHLTISAIAGGSVFDLTEPTFGTNGSMRGYSFEVIELTLGRPYLQSALTTEEEQITALYSDIVRLEGAQEAVEDLYGRLDINLSGLAWFGHGSKLQFFADTDTIAAVPEPQTMLLLGTGLIGLAAISKRRFIRRR